MKSALLKAIEIAARHRLAVAPPTLFAKSSDTRGALYIYEIIGEDWWTGGGVTAVKVVAALEAMKGVKVLDVFINSPGGDVFESKTIYENLVRFDAEKVVHVDGLAASGASLIAMAGDTIITSPAGTWMVHEAWTAAMGRASDMRAMADVLDMQNRSMAELYAGRTGGTVDAMLEVMAAETWMDAKQAKELGFTDEIAREDDQAGAGEQSKAAAAAPAARFAAQTSARVALARQGHRLRQMAAPAARNARSTKTTQEGSRP